MICQAAVVVMLWVAVMLFFRMTCHPEGKLLCRSSPMGGALGCFRLETSLEAASSTAEGAPGRRVFRIGAVVPVRLSSPLQKPCRTFWK